jgi:ribosomal-protein-alanine N-acetyltransferase
VTWPPFEVLTGPRVLVRAPAVGDEPALIEMATDPHVRRYLGGPQTPATAETNATAKINDARWGQFVIVEHATAAIAGSGSLARKRGPWEISYQLRHAFWGRGLAREAVDLVRAWFFTAFDDDLLIATTQQANLASQRLLDRLGATRAGSFEQYGLIQLRFEFHRPDSRSQPGERRTSPT